jgi:pyridoxal phosphate enzyme (YggS family)
MKLNGINMQMAERVAGIRRKMAQAAADAGRDPADISLCAACKAQTCETVRLSAALEIDIFGENRMQELREHLQAGAFAGKPCHFIGQLQTNKVRQVVGKVAMIQSVDSQRLLAAIQTEAEKQGLKQDILFEINLGQESSKAGADIHALKPLMEAAAACRNVKVRGLMAIPPAVCNEDETRRHFARLRQLLEKAQAWRYENAVLDILSMGMSGSYDAAIREGATIVRIGREIYGQWPVKSENEQRTVNS